MGRVLASLALASALAAEGKPLCADEGLWGTAWCLVVETGTLGRDATEFAFKSALPRQVLPHFKSVPVQLKSALPRQVLLNFESVRLTPLAAKLAELQRRLTTKCWSASSSIRRASLLQRIRAAAEKHRTSFVAAFPKHASLLPKGDIAGIVAVLIWLVSVLFLTLRGGPSIWQTWRRRPEVMFFPDKSGANVERIREEIARARHRVWLAMFTFTDDLLSEALVHAHERGVDVRVIVDDAQCEVKGAEASWLASSGVPVITDMSWARMHHKFMVADQTVLSGSFNWTRQASVANNENLCVLRDSVTVKAFASEFVRLWSQFNDRGGRLRGKTTRRRCHTPPSSRGGC